MGIFGKDKETKSKSISFVDTPYSLSLNGDDVVYVNCTNGDVEVFLPPLSAGRKDPYDIIKTDSTSNRVLLTGDSGELINGVNVQEIGIQYDSLRPHNNSGSSWGLL